MISYETPLHIFIFITTLDQHLSHARKHRGQPAAARPRIAFFDRQQRPKTMDVDDAAEGGGGGGPVEAPVGQDATALTTTIDDDGKEKEEGSEEEEDEEAVSEESSDDDDDDDNEVAGEGDEPLVDDLALVALAAGLDGVVCGAPTGIATDGGGSSGAGTGPSLSMPEVVEEGDAGRLVAIAEEIERVRLIGVRDTRTASKEVPGTRCDHTAE